MNTVLLAGIKIWITYTTTEEWAWDFVKEKLNTCQQEYVRVKPMKALRHQKIYVITYPSKKGCKKLERGGK